MVGQIVVLGEALIDMYSGVAGKSTDDSRLFRYEGVMGGAPCNVAVHLASLHLPVSLIASFADDPAGDELQRILSEWGVDLSYSKVHPRTRTPLAMVNVRPNGDRTFRLYLLGSAVEFLMPDMVDVSVFERAGWFHFGSVLLAFPHPKDVTLHLLQQCKERGVVTSYDINVRPDLWTPTRIDKRVMLDVLSSVDILKLSDEDFQSLANDVDPSLKRPRDLFRYGCQLIAYTEGAAGATLMTPKTTISFAAPDVAVVDTTGAGDAFMAGLIAGLRVAGIKHRDDFRNGISASIMQKAGQCATDRAASVLTRHGGMPVAKVETL